MKRRTLEERIVGFLGIWDLTSLLGLLRELEHLYQLYDVDENDDWLQQAVGDDNIRNVRLIRTVYLLSRIGDLYAGKLCMCNMKYKNIWRELEDATK